MSVPKLTDEDRKKALKVALESRTKRAQICDKLSKGQLSVSEVIDMRDDEVIGRLRVSRLIECVPSYGKTKTEKVMREIGISPTRRLKGLGRRQTKELLEIFS